MVISFDFGLKTPRDSLEKEIKKVALILKQEIKNSKNILLNNVTIFSPRDIELTITDRKKEGMPITWIIVIAITTSGDHVSFPFDPDEQVLNIGPTPKVLVIDTSYVGQNHRENHLIKS